MGIAFLSCMQSFYIQVTRGLRCHFFIWWAAHTEWRFVWCRWYEAQAEDPWREGGLCSLGCFASLNRQIFMKCLSHARHCPLSRGAESTKKGYLGSSLVQWKEPALRRRETPCVAQARPFAFLHLQDESQRWWFLRAFKALTGWQFSKSFFCSVTTLVGTRVDRMQITVTWGRMR